MSIRHYTLKDGTDRWSYIWRDRHPETGKICQREERGFASEKAAQRWGERSSALHPWPGQEKRHDERFSSFTELCQEWWARREPKLGTNTKKLYRQQLSDYICDEVDGLGALAPADVDQDQVDAFSARLSGWPRSYRNGQPRGPLSSSSCNRVLELLSTILNDAKENGWWAGEINWKRAVYPKQRRLVPVIGDEAFAALVANMRAEGDYRELVCLLRLCGLRIGEAVDLRVSELDFTKNVISVRHQHIRGEGGRKPTKTVEGVRKIPMEGAREMLRSLADRYQKGYVFRSVTGKRVDVDNFRFREWKEALDVTAAELEIEEILDWRLHDLRHRYAQNALERGASVQWLSATLGHSDEWVSLQYAKGGGLRPPSDSDSLSGVWKRSRVR